jgi:hypothetical protein
MLTVNLDHAILFGGFIVGTLAHETITSDNRPALFINNATNTVSGGDALIDVEAGLPLGRTLRRIKCRVLGYRHWSAPDSPSSCDGE